MDTRNVRTADISVSARITNNFIMDKNKFANPSKVKRYSNVCLLNVKG